MLGEDSAILSSSPAKAAAVCELAVDRCSTLDLAAGALKVGRASWPRLRKLSQLSARGADGSGMMRRSRARVQATYNSLSYSLFVSTASAATADASELEA